MSYPTREEMRRAKKLINKLLPKPADAEKAERERLIAEGKIRARKQGKSSSSVAAIRLNIFELTTSAKGFKTLLRRDFDLDEGHVQEFVNRVQTVIKAWEASE